MGSTAHSLPTRDTAILLHVACNPYCVTHLVMHDVLNIHAADPTCMID